MSEGTIRVLPEHIASKIAAGEVVQRPASVVKELLENSLDAGARSLVIVLKEGGTALIQVGDDGSGMSEEDAVNSFGRHATSKISSYEDLEAIATFGFRGEALASIAAVAQVTLTTRRPGDETAFVVQIDGGGAPRISRAAREPGTTVAVQRLFYNVPARRKFLRSPNTEFRHVYDAVHRVALSMPEIAIAFVSDGDEILRLRPAPLPQRLVDVFGDRQVEGLIPISEQGEGVSVQGYVSKPSFGLRTRAQQLLFLNRRPVASRNLNHAVYSAYENLMEKGSFPFFLLFIETDPRRVDVNVHPSKMEVKFEDEQGIYRLISAAVRKGLTSGEFFPSLTLTRGGGLSGEAGLRFTPGQHAGAPPLQGVDPRTGEFLPLAPSDGSAAAAALLGRLEERFAAPGPPQGMPPPSLPANGPLWQLHQKYILAPVESGVMIVDQHVAHERILYERILDRFANPNRSSQQLLFPATVEMSAGEASLLTELLPELQLLGFDVKPFGRNTFLLEGVPPEVKGGAEESILQEVLSLYREYRRERPTTVRDDLAKSLSCRSAVKAGDPLSGPEMRQLIDDLLLTRMPYVCPHGRPVVLRISLEEMDRRFGRT